MSVTSIEQLRVIVSVGDDVASVRVAGELDVFSAGQVTEAVAEACGAGMPKVVLDCSDLTFIDARGLDTLLVAPLEARRLGRRLTIREDAAGRIRRVALLTDTDESVLPLEPPAERSR